MWLKWNLNSENLAVRSPMSASFLNCLTSHRRAVHRNSGIGDSVRKILWTVLSKFQPFKPRITVQLSQTRGSRKGKKERDGLDDRLWRRAMQNSPWYNQRTTFFIRMIGSSISLSPFIFLSLSLSLSVTLFLSLSCARSLFGGKGVRLQT